MAGGVGVLHFLMFHQADRLVMSTVAPRLLEEFGIGYSPTGLPFSAALAMATALYPVWATSTTAAMWEALPLPHASSHSRKSSGNVNDP
ncbi:MAG: hypothetical protein DRN06_05940 [Thermoprotei archaeon]|nr:MAG: hypothetical protein DRN06_05940 [Thermoprotei archaeon]